MHCPTRRQEEEKVQQDAGGDSRVSEDSHAETDRRLARSHTDSADDYADDNYEDYMDSGEFDSEDEAWNAANDDFEDGDADW